MQRVFFRATRPAHRGNARVFASAATLRVASPKRGFLFYVQTYMKNVKIEEMSCDRFLWTVSLCTRTLFSDFTSVHLVVVDVSCHFFLPLQRVSDLYVLFCETDATHQVRLNGNWVGSAEGVKIQTPHQQPGSTQRSGLESKTFQLSSVEHSLFKHNESISKDG